MKFYEIIWGIGFGICLIIAFFIAESPPDHWNCLIIPYNIIQTCFIVLVSFMILCFYFARQSHLFTSSQSKIGNGHLENKPNNSVAANAAFSLGRTFSIILIFFIGIMFYAKPFFRTRCDKELYQMRYQVFRFMTLGAGIGILILSIPKAKREKGDGVDLP